MRIVLRGWFYKILTILIIGTLLSSCEKNPTSIGLNIQPGSDRMDLDVDTIGVITFTISEESIVSDDRSLSPLGSYLDPIFGFIQSDFIAHLRLSSSNANFSGEVETADSLILYLQYEGYYGDTSIVQQVHIYEMLEDVYKDSSYNSDFLPDATNLDELAQLSFTPSPSDSIIKIEMPQELINRLIDPGNTNSFSDNESFLDFFKGIYVTTDPLYSDGAILYMNLLSDNSRMTLYYNDSLSFDFQINTSSTRLNLFRHDYSLASDLSLNQVLDDTINPNTISFTQSLSGPKIKIEIPDLNDWCDSSNFAINKAQLIITAISDNNFAPPPELALIAINENGLNEFLTDYKVNSSYFGGNLNESLHTYTFNIPFHLQELFLGSNSKGMYLYPLNNRINAHRVQVYGGNHPDYPMHIEIMYSKY